MWPKYSTFPLRRPELGTPGSWRRSSVDQTNRAFIHGMQGQDRKTNLSILNRRIITSQRHPKWSDRRNDGRSLLVVTYYSPWNQFSWVQCAILSCLCMNGGWPEMHYYYIFADPLTVSKLANRIAAVHSLGNSRSRNIFKDQLPTRMMIIWCWWRVEECGFEDTK